MRSYSSKHPKNDKLNDQVAGTDVPGKRIFERMIFTIEEKQSHVHFHVVAWLMAGNVGTCRSPRRSKEEPWHKTKSKVTSNTKKKRTQEGLFKKKRNFVRMADNFQKVIPFSIAICDCNFPHTGKSSSIPYIKQPLMIFSSLEMVPFEAQTPTVRGQSDFFRNP